jgi:hypothetical protein
MARLRVPFESQIEMMKMALQEVRALFKERPQQIKGSKRFGQS